MLPTGNAYEVFPTGFIDPDGKEHDVNFDAPAMSQWCKSYSMPSDFDAMVKLIAHDLELLFALKDLAAVLTTYEVAVHCTRAIERIRRAVAGHDIAPKIGWAKMQTTLNADEAYITFITDPSKLARHGGRFAHSADDLIEIAKRTWILVDRYISLKRSGAENLSLTDFPLLQG